MTIAKMLAELKVVIDHTTNQDHSNRLYAIYESLEQLNGFDIGLELTLPHRITWKEYFEDGSVSFNYTTKEAFNACPNKKELI